MVIMQARLKPPTGGLLLVDTSIDINKNDLENAYAEMFRESIQFLYDVKSKRNDRRFSPEAIDLINSVRQAKSIQLICLAPTLPPVFHWGPGKKVLHEAIDRVLSEKSPDAWEMYSDLTRNGVISNCLLLCDPEPFKIHSFKRHGVSVLQDIDSWWGEINNSRINEYLGLPCPATLSYGNGNII
ncbi:MAG: hypothetical protein K8S24_01700 [Candidatus Aegiribacteria sp.]|nr:hypothetical protein [Candidatus Aegiribacteria sp.]